MRGVTLLGATGSIGDSTSEVLRAHADRFRVVALAAGRDAQGLAARVREFRPALATLAAPKGDSDELRAACASSGTQLLTGPEAAVEAARHPDAEVVVAAIVGAAGLPATAAAVERGAVVALANKESLVVAGEALTRRAAARGATLLPVDSEHAAIHQCLRAGRREEVRRLVLTASGGPFRERPAAAFATITVEDALRHPTWSMGPKITIDSATLMNKGLEVIEAHWLFGFPGHAIDVVLHPQSIVHSLVEFRDGSVLAQLNRPDMKDPIRYCLSHPERWESGGEPLDLAAVGPLTFEEPDGERFPCLGLARQALETGGAAPAVLNAANEVAVRAFLDGRLPFTGIAPCIEEALGRAAEASASTLEEALDADRRGRAWAEETLARGVEVRR